MSLILKEVYNRMVSTLQQHSSSYRYILLIAILFLGFAVMAGCKKEPAVEIEVSSITLDKPFLSLAKGVETTLIPRLAPFTASEAPVTWESANPAVASVVNGKVTAKAYGTTVITAKAGNQTATCSVTVKSAVVGVYYFDGWSGTSRYANTPSESWWAENAPTHLTRQLIRDYSGRQPLWGWRNDTQEIMETQIDLMADNGVDFMLYCWYWQTNRGPINVEAINNDSKHTSLRLYLNAKNKQRVQYALLVANHDGGEIIGPSNWEAAVRHWVQYFRDPLYVHVDGKPLVVLFGATDDTITNEDIAKMQETARRLGFKDGLSIAGNGSAARNKDFNFATHYNLTTGYGAGSVEKDYQVIINHSKDRWIGTESHPYIPVITAGWDSRPWEGERPEGLGGDPCWYFTGDTPEVFKDFLGDAITWMDNNPTKTPKERLVLIYAWNEIGEGGYLVPTIDDPKAAKLKKIGELLKERSK